jgi:hypothetical protein
MLCKFMGTGISESGIRSPIWKPGHPASRAAFKSRAADIFASTGKSSLPRKNARMFLNTICQKRNFWRGIISRISRDGPAHLQQFDIGLDIGPKGHFDNVVDPIRSECGYACLKFLIVTKHFMSAGIPRCFFFRRGPDSPNYVRSATAGELDCAETYGSFRTRHQYGVSVYGSRNKYWAVGSNAGDAETRSLFRRYVIGQRSDFL